MRCSWPPPGKACWAACRCPSKAARAEAEEEAEAEADEEILMAASSIAVTQGAGTLIATHTISEAGTKHLSRIVINDPSGAEVDMAKDSTLTDGSQKTEVTILPALIAGTARVGRIVLDGMPESEYSLSLNLVPSTLTDGITYFAIKNTGTNVMRIHSLLALLSFTGTPAATRSLYSLQRFTGTTPTGGTAATPSIRDSANAVAASVDARHAPGGVTTTGVTFGSVLMLMGHLSAAEDVVISPALENAPLILRPSEGLALRANGAVISGSIVTLNLVWREEAP